jgi:hypothetical protein
MTIDSKRVAWSDVGRVAAATATMTSIRLALWLLPFRVVRAAVRRFAAPRRGFMNRPTVDDVTSAVARAARVVPRATCLTQSLTASVLLGRHGYPTTLRLGVAREAGRFDAHAWVECEGRVVVGDADLHRYAAVAPISDP